MSPALSHRSYNKLAYASSWEELWEAGPYYERLSELLEDASHYAIFAGWQIDSRLPMPVPARPNSRILNPSCRETLKEKLTRLCEKNPDFHVYLLMWSHAYFYIWEREAWQARVWEKVHPRIHFIFDNRHPFGAAHHEKIGIIDGKIGFCGGVDLCDERWDTPKHFFYDPRRSLNWKFENHGPYHDLTVQVTGPVCAELQNHVARRWRALSSVPFPDPPLSISRSPVFYFRRAHPVYISRTVANVESTPLRLVREIEFLFKELILNANHRIILEGQYYWSPAINDVLISKIHQMKGQGFEVYLILAELRELKAFTRLMAIHELKLLRKLEDAAKLTGTRLVVGTPYVAPPSGSAAGPARRKRVYIHSKLLIIDDRFISIGSANFSSRALRVDTEIQLTLAASTEAERCHIRKVSEKVLDHWRQKDTTLQRYHSRDQEQEIKAILPWSSKLPWEVLFDPVFPWGFTIRKKFRKRLKNHFGIIVLGTVAGGAFLSESFFYYSYVKLGIAPIPVRLMALITYYTVILSSASLLPIPYLLTSLLVTLHLGFRVGVLISILSFWSASFSAYLLIRLFPTLAIPYYRSALSTGLHERFTKRSFPSLLRILLDPRYSFRVKTILQGHYCIPWPWFLVGNGFMLCIVLSGSLYLVGLWAKEFSSFTSPDFAPYFVSAIAGFALWKEAQRT